MNMKRKKVPTDFEVTPLLTNTNKGQQKDVANNDGNDVVDDRAENDSLTSFSRKSNTTTTKATTNDSSPDNEGGQNHRQVYHGTYNSTNLSRFDIETAKSVETTTNTDEGENSSDEEFSTKTTTTTGITTRTPFFAYVLLFTAVVSLSAIGPLLLLQEDASPTMKIIWRMMGASMLLSTVVAYEISIEGLPRLNRKQWSTFLLATVGYDVMTLSFVISLDYTSVGNACVLANSLPLILLMGKLCLGQHVTWMEGGGAIVAFVGTALVSNDSSASHMEGSNLLLGVTLGIISAFGGVGYLIFAKSSRSAMSTTLFMFLTMFLGGIIAWIFQIFILQEPTSFDMDYHHGLWAFLLPQRGRLPLELAVVIVCNLCGTMGYVRVMQYFDSLVISSIALLEPAIAQFISFAFGLGPLPGLLGWTGNVLVGFGTFAVIYVDAKENGPGSSQEKTGNNEKVSTTCEEGRG